jgi:hypothetical protein
MSGRFQLALLAVLTLLVAVMPSRRYDLQRS